MIGSPQEAIQPGFPDPVFDSQRAFRSILLANAYAGRAFSMDIGLSPPKPLGVATAALCLTLADLDTPMWLDRPARAVEPFLRFHTGVVATDRPDQSRFALIADPASMPALDAFGIGEIKYPDRSTTLFIQVPTLDAGIRKSWSGPGINGCLTVKVGGLPDRFWQEWSVNFANYPLGVDIFFTCGVSVLAMPRTVKVES